MKKLFLVFLFSTVAFSQPGLIRSFELEPSDIALTRLAQPGTPFDKVGRRFAILGFESGTFEAWAYPLKLIRSCELSFFIGSSTEPIRARDIVRHITVTPEATILTSTYQSFTIKAIFITPIDEPGAMILLDVSATEPLTIVCSFLPVLQPMWPAGLGGQSAYWLNDIKAYQISEPTRRNTALIGSPSASGISYTPAHMLSDVPNQFKIEIRNPKDVAGKFIPIFLAGGNGSRDTVKAVYLNLMKNPEEHYRRTVEHYRSLRAGTLQIETPDRSINLALEWAKIAYDNLMVRNPDLGYGMVAGLGASGTGGRPGFGWFFGGDTYINSFSLNSYGAFETVRDALAFTRKFQRDDGKMPHEVSQGAGYINWFKDYPYAYIHGDTSPFYICAMYDYYRMSGDLQFIRDSWQSIVRAYEWSLATDGNGDGLMDNKNAGLGAMEYGPLTDIQSDVYTGAVWVRAAKAMADLARAVGDDAFVTKAQRYASTAARAWDEKFWDPQRQQYAYAFTASGEHVDIVSPWSSVGLHWELGNPERSSKTLAKLNSSELTTDWGIRSISNKSAYFEPLNYNYGAVWPFLTSWVATAQYKHGFALQGFNSLMASVRHTFDNALGSVTEVFSGTLNIWPQEAVAHQGFCTAGVVLPLIRGMLGLEADANTRTILFSPQLPANWKSCSIRNYRVGNDFFSFDYVDDGTRKTWKITSTATTAYTIRFVERISPGMNIVKYGFRGDGEEGRGSLAETRLVLEGSVHRQGVVEIDYEGGFALLPPDVTVPVGGTNSGLKIIQTTWEGKRLVVDVEGLAGTAYDLAFVRGDLVAGVSGCVRKPAGVVIHFPGKPTGEFVQKRIEIGLK